MALDQMNNMFRVTLNNKIAKALVKGAHNTSVSSKGGKTHRVRSIGGRGSLGNPSIGDEFWPNSSRFESVNNSHWGIEAQKIINQSIDSCSASGGS